MDKKRQQNNTEQFEKYCCKMNLAGIFYAATDQSKRNLDLDLDCKRILKWTS